MNILEARKLVGVNINPAVFIRVGNQKKNTQTQKSTNCPFYNEVRAFAITLRCGVQNTALLRNANRPLFPLPPQNFQFEFQEYPQIFFDKVIEIKVRFPLWFFSCFTFTSSLLEKEVTCIVAAHTGVPQTQPGLPDEPHRNL